MQIFTQSYPDSDQKGPQFLVLFTNYSRSKTEDDATAEGSYDEEDEETVEESKQALEPQDLKTSGISMETYITEYKKDLVNQLADDQLMVKDR